MHVMRFNVSLATTPSFITIANFRQDLIRFYCGVVMSCHVVTKSYTIIEGHNCMMGQGSGLSQLFLSVSVDES